MNAYEEVFNKIFISTRKIDLRYPISNYAISKRSSTDPYYGFENTCFSKKELPLDKSGLNIAFVSPFRSRESNEYFTVMNIYCDGNYSRDVFSRQGAIRSFLKRDGTLDSVSGDDVIRIRNNNGLLYYEETDRSVIMATLRADDFFLRPILKETKKYSIKIRFTKVTAGQTPRWGYYLENALFHANYDTLLIDKIVEQEKSTDAPFYFCTESKGRECVFASLVSIELVDENGLVVMDVLNPDKNHYTKFLDNLYKRAAQLYENNDIEKALKFYNVAAKHGNEKAMLALADHYDKKDDTKSQSLVWYKKAAQIGNPESQYLLGDWYAKREGRRNVSNALAWYHEAAKKGLEKAKQKLQELLSKDNVKEKENFLSWAMEGASFNFENLRQLESVDGDYLEPIAIKSYAKWGKDMIRYAHDPFSASKKLTWTESDGKTETPEADVIENLYSVYQKKFVRESSFQILGDETKIEGDKVKLTAKFKVPFRVSVDDPTISVSPIDPDSPSRCLYVDKEARLVMCSSQDANALIKQNEIVYDKAQAYSVIYLNIEGDKELLKDISKNTSDYKARIHFSHMSLERQDSDVYYRRDAWLKSDRCKTKLDEKWNKEGDQKFPTRIKMSSPASEAVSVMVNTISIKHRGEIILDVLK